MNSGRCASQCLDGMEELDRDGGHFLGRLEFCQTVPESPRMPSLAWVG